MLFSIGDKKNNRVKLTPIFSKEQIIEMKRKEWIKQTRSSLTYDEKIGQTIIWHIDKKELSPEDAEVLKMVPFGGVIIMGSHTSKSLKKLTDQINAIPSSLPRFIAIDQEGGIVKHLIDDPLPSVQHIASLSFENACSLYKNSTSLLLESGVNLNFGIVADIGWYKHTRIYPRTFSDNAITVSDMVQRAASCSSEILSTVKHFPGHGRTPLNSHYTIPHISIDQNEWTISDAVPFKKAIDNKIPVIMLGHLVYDKIASDPASLSSFWTNKLRGMGFKGVIITDDLHMLETGGMSINNIITQAVYGGADILLFDSFTLGPYTLFNKIKSLWRTREHSEEILNNQIDRILNLKYSLIL